MDDPREDPQAPQSSTRCRCTVQKVCLRNVPQVL